MPINLIKFQSTWLEKKVENVPLNEWLECTEDVYTAKCTLCNEKFDISRSGLSQVKSHHKRKKHARKFNLWFENVYSILDAFKENTGGVCEDDLSHEQKVARAENIWALYAVKSNMSFQLCSEYVDLFKVMFTDSKIAADMKITEEKFEEMKSIYLAEKGNNQ